jgi:heme oxygenase
MACPVPTKPTAGAPAAAISPLLKRLRQETHGQHAALEAQLPLLDRSLTREAYVWLLGRFWGFYSPLEDRLIHSMRRHVLSLDYSTRRKTPLLEKDLGCLGMPQRDLPRCALLPALAEVAELLGCLYVIEGSTLGGQVITQRLAAHLALNGDAGGAFFSGYGAATGAHWREFGSFLTATALSLDRDDEVVAGANATFRTFADWLLPS